MSRSEAHEARNQALRAGLASPAAAREASIPTKDLVPGECQKLGAHAEVEEVPDSQGARIHWIGDKSNERVVLYFHGGGFSLPPFPGHVIFWVQTQERLAKQGKPFVVAFLEYGLTPQHRFPTQHMQGVQALKHILHSGRKPSDVIIGGDSAGGHLTLGVIAASVHSHDGIPALKLDAPLRGAILISPWTSFSTDTQSYQDNIDKDIVTVEGMVIMRDEFVSSLSKDEFAEPMQADSEWWADAPVKSILNLAGTHELFFDHIKDLGVKLKEAGVNVQTVECAKQVHIDCILDAQTGFEPGPMSFALCDWLAEVL